MKKILLPIDGSRRSTQTVKWVQSRYNPQDVELALLFVREDYDEIRCIESQEEAKTQCLEILEPFAKELSEYKVTKCVIFGRAGEEIVNYADTHDIDMIMITKSTKEGFLQRIGSVSAHVVRYAHCEVVIVPEK